MSTEWLRYEPEPSTGRELPATWRWMRDLRVVPVEIGLDPQRPWRAPPWPAVALRGALGRAVMDIACVREDRRCRACDRSGVCPVTTWYDPGRVGSHLLRPYALQVSRTRSYRPGRQLVVRQVFLRPLPRPSLFAEAVLRAARVGLGSERVPHRVKRLRVFGPQGWETVVEDDRPATAWPEPVSLDRIVRPLAPRARGVRLSFMSPLSFKRPGRPAAADVLRAVIGRLRGVAREQDRRLERWWPGPDSLGGQWKGLRRQEQSRWSQNAGEHIDLSGWRGTLELGPESTPFFDAFAAVEPLQLGRHTTAGLGRMRVEWVGRA